MNVKQKRRLHDEIKTEWLVVLDTIYAIVYENDWSWKEFSDASGVSAETIRKWFKVNSIHDFYFVRSDTIGKMMKACGLTFEILQEGGVDVLKLNKAA